MKIGPEIVRHVAQLARLEVEDTDSLAAQLSSILDYIDEIAAFETSAAPPDTSSDEVDPTRRPDTARPATGSGLAHKAADVIGDEVRVPTVVERTP